MDEEDKQPDEALWKYVLLGIMLVGGIVFLGILLFDDPGQNFGTMRFSLDPVARTGFGADAAPPAFNVTLRASNPFKHSYCGESATVRVVYDDVVLAIAGMEPFCVEGRSTAVLRAAASPGWPALPLQLRERIQSDTLAGGAELEVDFKFYNSKQGATRWVRCRTPLDAKQARPCKLFTFVW